MNWLEITTDIAILLTAIAAIVTIILKLIKEAHYSKPSLFRRELNVYKNFGDVLANFGLGPMTIIGIKYLYHGNVVEVDSIYEIFENLYASQLQPLHKTYLKNKDLIGRTICSGQEISLLSMDISGCMNKNDLKDKLKGVHEAIKIEWKYKDIYGREHTIVK